MDDIKLTKLAKCAGCGAKVGAGVLGKLLGGLKTVQDENLLVGYDKSDDASVYKVSEELAIVNTVDFFPPIVDDPYTFGRIAATNALSDVYAMGGEPKLAQNILGMPKEMPGDAVREILRGGYDAAYEAGAIITGGHSILLTEPVYGLAVTGFVRPDRVLKNCGVLPGDVLILTKPLGVGIVMTGQKAGLASEEAVESAVRQMTALNRAARGRHGALPGARLHRRNWLFVDGPRAGDGAGLLRDARHRRGRGGHPAGGAGIGPYGHPARGHVPQPQLRGASSALGRRAA